MDRLEDFHIKYKSQPRELLQTVYEKKCYHLFLSAVPLFVQLIGKVDPGCALVSEIILDLLERKEAILALLPRIPMLHESFILTQAVERKIVIDFSHCLFDKASKEFYYETILRKDCLELFTLYQEDILAMSVRPVTFQRIIAYSSLQILKCIKISKEDCDFCLGRALEKDERNEEILAHLSSLYDNRQILRLYLFRDFYSGYREQVAMLLRIGANPDEEMKKDFQKMDPEQYIQLFGEDV